MNILVYDIETSPNLSHVWDLYSKSGVNPQMVIAPTEVLCFAAKWHGERTVTFCSQWQNGYDNMITAMHGLLSQADAAVTYNGNRFDKPHVNREFLTRSLKPPAPYADIDLYRVVKRHFKFPSASLNFVSKQLGIGAKVQHSGYALWRDLLLGDETARLKAQALIEKYNIGDVNLTDKLYVKLLPWIDNHPSYATLTGEAVCRNCGSARLVKEGLSYTAQRVYQRYSCKTCGTWGRSTRSMGGADIAGVRL